MNTARPAHFSIIVMGVRIIAVSTRLTKEMSKDLKNAVIKVTGIETKQISFKDKVTGEEKSFTKHVIVADKNKFEFSETKADGSETAAWKAIKEYHVSPGDTLEIGYGERERKYTDPQGNERTTTDRTIAFLRPTDQAPQSPVESVNKIETPDLSHFEGILKDHEKRIATLEFRADAEEMINE